MRDGIADIMVIIIGVVLFLCTLNVAVCWVAIAGSECQRPGHSPFEPAPLTTCLRCVGRGMVAPFTRITDDESSD